MKKFPLLLILLLPVLLAAQPNTQSLPATGSWSFTKSRLLRGQATLAPGIMTGMHSKSIYMHGNLEYYLDRKISIRGDGFAFIGPLGVDKDGDKAPFLQNHQLFAGASRHMLTRGRFDPYFGLEMGVAGTQSNGVYLQVSHPQSVQYNPLISPHFGFNIYGERIFHIFAEAEYIFGKHFPDGAPATSLNELRFSFGLGLNFFVPKKKTTE